MRLTVSLFGIGAILLGIVVGELALRGLKRWPVKAEWYVPGGESARGREAIQRYGCGSCHAIGGVHGATARVGPRLTGIREQSYLAGRLPNVPHQMVYWIQNPQKYEPGSAMPNLGVTEPDARDIAAYLYTKQ